MPFSEKQKSMDTDKFIREDLDKYRDISPESKIFNREKRKDFLGGLIKKHYGSNIEKSEFKSFIEKIQRGEVEEINKLGPDEKSRITRYLKTFEKNN